MVCGIYREGSFGNFYVVVGDVFVEVVGNVFIVLFFLVVYYGFYGVVAYTDGSLWGEKVIGFERWSLVVIRRFCFFDGVCRFCF